MQRFGYQEGSGLGRFGQGISQALKVERTGRNLGLIVNREGPEESTNKRFKQGIGIMCKHKSNLYMNKYRSRIYRREPSTKYY
jgi:hypothetical protein